MQTSPQDLWHPLRAQATYDALVYLVTTRDFCGFFESFVTSPPQSVVSTVRALFDSIDAAIETWDLTSSRPNNYTDSDKDWCILQERQPTLGELRRQYRKLLNLPLRPGDATLKAFVTRRLPPEEFAALLRNPPPEHRDLLENVLEAQKRLKCT